MNKYTSEGEYPEVTIKEFYEKRNYVVYALLDTVAFDFVAKNNIETLWIQAKNINEFVNLKAMSNVPISRDDKFLLWQYKGIGEWQILQFWRTALKSEFKEVAIVRCGKFYEKT